MITPHYPDPALLAAVLANPADDLPRLIYADRLEECDGMLTGCGHGHHEPGKRYSCQTPNGFAAWAELIRVQCEIERLRAIVARWAATPSDQIGGRAEDGGEAGAALAKLQSLERREQELFDTDDSAAVARWFGTSPTGFRFATSTPPASPPGDSDPYFVVRRGFVDGVVCPAYVWHEAADDLLARHPITRVDLTTRPDRLIYRVDQIDLDAETSRGFVVDLHVEWGKWSGGTRKIRFGRDEIQGLAFNERMYAAIQRRIAGSLSEPLSLLWPGIAFTVPAAPSPHDSRRAILEGINDQLRDAYMIRS